MRPIDQAEIRRQNLRRVVDALIECRTVTQKRLAEKTGLSLMSVSNLTEQLDKQGALSFQEAPRPEGRPRAGRRATWISLRRDRNAFLALDLMDRHFRFATLGLDRRVGRVGAPWPYDDRLGYAENLGAFLRALKADATLDVGGALGVAVIAPGPYDPATDSVANARVPELNGVRVKRMLGEALGEAFFYVDEDVLFAARAHAKDGEEGLMFYLYVGEGVSGAMVKDGFVVRGLNGMAGEIGQLAGATGERHEAYLRLDALADRLLGSDWVGRDVDRTLSRLARFAGEEPEAYRRAMDAVALRVAELMGDCLWLLDPCRVVVDCLYAPNCEEALARPLRRELARRFPNRRLPLIEAADSAVKDAYLGAADALRAEWINRMA